MNSRGHIPDERLAAFFDDELSPQAAADIERHVATCSTCQDRLATMQEARRAAQSFAELPPDGCRDDLWARIEAELPDKKQTAEEERTAVQRTTVLWAALTRLLKRRAVQAALGVLLVAGIAGLWIAGPPLSPDFQSPQRLEQTASLGFDFGLYLTALKEPARMKQFTRIYDRRPVSLREALATTRFADDAVLDALPEGLTLKAVYLLNDACCTSIQMTLRHNGSKVTVFRQAKGHPIRFEGYEIQPATIGARQCLMIDGGRYCAVQFSAGDSQYVVIGRRDDPTVTKVIGHLIGRRS